MITYYTPEEVAKMLKVNQVTVTRLLRSGRLKGFKVGARLWRISQDQLDKFLQASSS